MSMRAASRPMRVWCLNIIRLPMTPTESSRSSFSRSHVPSFFMVAGFVSLAIEAQILRGLFRLWFPPCWSSSYKVYHHMWKASFAWHGKEKLQPVKFFVAWVLWKMLDAWLFLTVVCLISPIISAINMSELPISLYLFWSLTPTALKSMWQNDS